MKNAPRGGQITRPCKLCGAGFQVSRQHKFYCSGDCRTEQDQEDRREYAARYRRGKRAPARRICRQCGAKFVPKTEKTFICSDACRLERRRELARRWMAEHPPKE